MPSSTDTELIQLLKLGNKNAANLLIERYFDRVVALARRRLAGKQFSDSSGDDIAASVFESLWQRAREHRFADEELRDSRELWKLLCRMIYFKSQDHVRRASAAKRTGGIESGSTLRSGAPAIDQVAECRHGSDGVSIFREEHQRLLDLLGDSHLAQIAVMRLEGYSVAEIADAFTKSLRWVGRKLALIRGIWKAEFEALG